jgi:hypothetical protein
VPLEKAPFDQPVFRNEWVTVLKIDVPPHRDLGFHTHMMDSVSINIEAADMANTLPGQPRTPPQRSRRGQANFKKTAPSGGADGARSGAHLANSLPVCGDRSLGGIGPEAHHGGSYHVFSCHLVHAP